MVFRMAGVVLALLLACAPASGQSRLSDELESLDDPAFELAQDSDVRITPSEAAAIAQDAVPGAAVLKVKLLSSGVYAVTLKAKGSVLRVMVSADDGSIQ